MKFTLVLSTFIAAAIAAPTAECQGGNAAPAPTIPAQCEWDVNGEKQVLNVADSVTLNGVNIACGTTGSVNFGVGAKCKLQRGQDGTCDTFEGVEGKSIKCVYKTSGTANRGTCKN